MTARGDVYRFGPFRLDPEVGILFCEDEPTMLGQRAVALLQLLIQNAGQPVSKDALIDAGWGGSAIADNNLTVQIAALRRTLADAANVADWIETLPRRGYRYVGPAVATNVPDASAAVRAGSAPSLPEKPSVAVLPFSNLSGDPQQEYFADGMVDDIITGLARIKWLFVIARNSTFSYKGRAVDVKQVGRELGVRYVLEGSVRKAGHSVRVTAQLIDASTGTHIWAERYDRSSDDIFALQDEIALAAVGAIAPSVRKAEIERVRRKRPDSLDAYDLVLQAQPDVDSGMPEQVTRALVLLERAIALEPTYALAHGNAAMCHHCLFLRAGLQEINRASSIRYARSAIVHGQDDALALTWAGFSIGMDAHDRASAFAALEAALAISPSSALTYILGSVILGWSGEAERAIEWSEQGLRLSPFDSWAWAAFDAQAMSHLLRGRYEEACRAAYKSVQANPAHSITYVQLAAALAKLGRLDEARAAAARVLELQPGFRYSRQFAGVNCAPALAKALGNALREAGLPE
ncbi:tetratricopeptide repeat protein [Mesorhizobium sp. M2D.F.Ca.ET.171.01.1.1]|uniref:winged helix-turn-helix domain-containing tetratricopeptide repeat protein n=4 Tax=Mesorhizobium TaxID=68287 RepID=UPI0010918BF2|nr:MULTISPECIES: winged helix-turn-helix domain-containing tetratricopeptide repeat protein [unclassified Mesorhizobium]TGP96825.1 tetratricopeptide repeat protein [bacterium M00.F.Ca.ET.221.01.1.1]TGU06712.1 tetratricopeptide repeat protein [bacterium M00.F.Ca.ET.163.01.1.1]TGU50037.1 tetratricopeptide repeat protein [bacterium M00.F.Ca.ET.146.01.1.1]TGP37050.1 tetratricopeptide repeat protein [Mesorhizobium sp. M2D.F.Ca.ET.232.01.1.1]TGP71761.1 tetratricopeptide repeat protein [Mesorhizobium